MIFVTQSAFSADFSLTYHSSTIIYAKFHVSTPSGLAYSVRTDRKSVFLKEFEGFWGAKLPIFKLQKRISHNSSNPHTNVIYMTNFRFLHRAVWRTACEQTGKYGFLKVFEGFWRAKRPIFELRK